MKLDLVGIIKDNIVYVKEKVDYSSQLERKLRFDAEEKESFDSKWRVFTEVPKVAELFTPGYEALLKYKLKDGFTPTTKTPQYMTMDAFKCCDDECENSEIRGLYEPVYRKEPDFWEIVEMDLEIIDSNCKPLIKPKYKYFVKFPGYIDNHMIVHHTMPCFIKGTDAYELIRTAVKNNIPCHCKITSDYDFVFEVQTTVPYVGDPLRSEKKTIIYISQEGYTYGGKVHDIHADNYYLLEEKMDSIIQGHIDKMETKIHVCPNCHGRGWIEDENHINGDK